MNYIKKNWVMLSCLAVSLVVLGIFIVMMLENSKQREQYEAEIEKYSNNFRKMNGTRLKMKLEQVGDEEILENKIIAMNNNAKATQYYNNIKQELGERFNYTPEELPISSVMAQNTLQKRLRLMANEISQSSVAWQSGAVGGILNQLSQQNVPIPAKDFPTIFRQLNIYERIVAILLKSGISTIRDLSFPNGLDKEDKGEYYVTLVSLTAEGNATSLQKLANDLTTCSNMLFFIMHMEFSSVNSKSASDIYTDMVLQGAKKNNDLQSAFSEPLDSAAQQQNTRTRRRGRPSRTARVSEDDSGPSADNAASSALADDEADWVKEEPKRQDYLVFKEDGPLMMNLGLRLIEYKHAEQSNDGRD